jgi:endogenous inhibitor of DNA gyrase (YacG/DUF329 family)
VVTIAGEPDAHVAGVAEADCPACGGDVTVTYEDQWLRFACTRCDGLFGDAAPNGTLLNAPFPPPGLVGRTPDGALETELYRCMLDLTSMMQGVCPECASAVRGSLSVCDEHDAGPEHSCSTCGTPFAAWGDLRCGTCQFAKRLPVELCAMALPPVIGFLYARGVNVLAPSLDDLFGVVRSRVTTTVRENPSGVVTTIGGDDDGVMLTLDEHLTVVDITR